MSLPFVEAFDGYDYNVFALPVFSACAVIAFLGSFTLIKAWRSFTGISFSLFSLSLVVWLFGIAMDYLSKTETLADFWSRFVWCGVVFIASTFYFFISSYTGTVKENRWIIGINFLVSFFFLALLPTTDLLIQGAYLYPWGYYPKTGWMAYPFLTIFVIQWFGSLLYCLRKFREATDVSRRKKLIVLFIAYLALFIAAVDYLPALGIKVFPFGFIPVLCVSSIIFYAIVQYQLWDVSTVVHKTLMWLISWGAIFVVVTLLWLWFANDLSTLPIWWSSGIIMFTSATFVLYIRFVQPKVDHLFQRKRYSAQAVLQAFIAKLAELRGLDDLLAALASVISDVLYVDKLSMYVDTGRNGKLVRTARSSLEGPESISHHKSFLTSLKEADFVMTKNDMTNNRVRSLSGTEIERYFNECRVAVCIPLIHDRDLIAVINLGEKRNLRNFTRLDVELLERLRVEGSIALSNALLYEDVTQLSKNLEKKVEERTTELKIANEKLKEVDKAKSAFFANVSHELKTPMTLVVTPLDNLLQKMPKTAGEVILPRRTFESVRHNAYRLSALISDILDLTKSEIGKARISPVQIQEPKEFVRKICDSVAPLVEEKGLRLEFAVGPPPSKPSSPEGVPDSSDRRGKVAPSG